MENKIEHSSMATTATDSPTWWPRLQSMQQQDLAEFEHGGGSKFGCDIKFLNFKKYTNYKIVKYYTMV
jgi:hypothetical protein